MATTYNVYLFDLRSFSVMLSPALEQLYSGNYRALRDIAYRVAKEHEDIWDVLEDYRFYPDDIGAEDTEFATPEDRIKFWIMIVLTSCCVPLEIPSSYLKDMRAFLDEVGTENALIDKITRGKPIAELFMTMVEPNEFALMKRNFWEYFGMVGWLDSSDIQKALEYLSSLDDKYCFRINDDEFMNKERILAYQTAKRMFSKANASSKGLFLSITD